MLCGPAQCATCNATMPLPARCLLGVGEQRRHCGTAAVDGAPLGAALPLLVRRRRRSHLSLHEGVPPAHDTLRLAHEPLTPRLVGLAKRQAE